MKGPGTLVAAFEALSAHDPEVSLTLLGTGADPAAVLAAFPPGLRQRVTVRPGLPHSEVLAAMGEHDLLLATSLFEGFGTVVIEAMAAGLPVVASAAGGASDYIETGRNGYLAAPGDAGAFAQAAQTLLSLPPGKMLILRQAARESVRTLTWDRIAATTLAAYSEELTRLRH
jgi:2-deoxystreptamine N-acetyl-D-glucosaminyltransferase/2-deoxystreptamine glucosyltransferase